jgi:hypothetical protein
VLDEERVERDPVPFGDDLPQLCLRLYGGPRPHDPEPVRDAVDVGVHRDRGDRVAEDEDAVRGLGSDPPDRLELRERPRDDPAEPVADLACALADHPGLRMVEAGLPDQGFDLARIGGGEGGRVRVPGEQSGARDVGVRVAGALREDGADQHLEGILGVVPQVRTSPVAPAVERAQPVEELVPPHPVRPREYGHDRPTVRREPAGGSTPAGSGTCSPRPGSERSGSSIASEAARKSSPTR